MMGAELWQADDRNNRRNHTDTHLAKAEFGICNANSDVSRTNQTKSTGEGAPLTAAITGFEQSKDASKYVLKRDTRPPLRADPGGFSGPLQHKRHFRFL